MKYRLYDIVNKNFIKGEYSTFVRAQRKADKLDLSYGGIRYVVKSETSKIIIEETKEGVTTKTIIQ